MNQEKVDAVNEVDDGGHVMLQEKGEGTTRCELWSP